MSECLLQRTRAENVVPVFADFALRWPTFVDLAAADLDELEQTTRSLGLAKRSLAMRRLGEALEAIGRVPANPAELIRLPGVGPYAAHAVPVFTHNRRLPVIDWVIARVLRRYFALPTDKRPNADKALWALGTDLAGQGRARELWLGILDLAAAVCRPGPLCQQCPLFRSCDFAQSGGQMRTSVRQLG